VTLKVYFFIFRSSDFRGSQNLLSDSAAAVNNPHLHIVANRFSYVLRAYLVAIKGSVRLSGPKSAK
jgi:hypothetical protein